MSCKHKHAILITLKLLRSVVVKQPSLWRKFDHSSHVSKRSAPRFLCSCLFDTYLKVTHPLHQNSLPGPMPGPKNPSSSLAPSLAAININDSELCDNEIPPSSPSRRDRPADAWTAARGAFNGDLRRRRRGKRDQTLMPRFRLNQQKKTRPVNMSVD